jgi:hypothetical protein
MSYAPALRYCGQMRRSSLLVRSGRAATPQVGARTTRTHMLNLMSSVPRHRLISPDRSYVKAETKLRAASYGICVPGILTRTASQTSRVNSLQSQSLCITKAAARASAASWKECAQEIRIRPQSPTSSAARRADWLQLHGCSQAGEERTAVSANPTTRCPQASVLPLQAGSHMQTTHARVS